MRSRLVLKEIISVVLAVVFVVLLSIPIGPLPPLGGLLNPNGGVWTTAEGARPPAMEELRVPGLDETDPARVCCPLAPEFARASLPERGRDAQTDRPDPHDATIA